MTSALPSSGATCNDVRQPSLTYQWTLFFIFYFLFFIFFGALNSLSDVETIHLPFVMLGSRSDMNSFEDALISTLTGPIRSSAFLPYQVVEIPAINNSVVNSILLVLFPIIKVAILSLVNTKGGYTHYYIIMIIL